MQACHITQGRMRLARRALGAPDPIKHAAGSRSTGLAQFLQWSGPEQCVCGWPASAGASGIDASAQEDCRAKRIQVTSLGLVSRDLAASR